MNNPDSPRRHPFWLRQTKRLFPHPLFAGCVSLACLAVGILFAGCAINLEGCWPMAFPSVLFFAGTFATASAAIMRSEKEPPGVSPNAQTDKPTFAIFVLLVGVYSWLLLGAIYVFDAFFKSGPGSPKYFLTLGMATISTLFMQFYGNRVVREHFGASGGRNLELNARQALYVTVFSLFLGIYTAWLML